MTVDEVLEELRQAADPSRLPGMARVGIVVEGALGVSVPHIRRIAKAAGHDTALAQALWETGIHEARMVAGLVADPATLSFGRMRAWARDIDSWDLGDLLADAFAATPHVDRSIDEWSRARHGFTRRCAFAMIARVAVSDKGRPDGDFLAWLPLIRRAATDERNEVKKAVSWALRQIGKRNPTLYRAARIEANAMLEGALASGSRSARWIARDVLRELGLPAHAARLGG
ncbi:MAG TPA: DNA alkylation repair protein [Actinomycetota bacterium]